MNSCLVTGATGFIGIPLVAQLLSHGRQVHILVRPTSNLAPLHAYLRGRNLPESNLVVHAGDLSQPLSDKIHEVLKGVSEVYHFAADVTMLSTPAAVRRINIDGTRNILRACRDTQSSGIPKKIIVASTVAVYPPSKSVLNEHSPFRRGRHANPYAESKILMERLINRYVKSGLNIVTLRPSGVYGPHAPYIFPQLVRYVLRNHFEGIPRAQLQQPHTLCHVQDVVNAAIFVGSHSTKPGDVFNVAEPSSVTTQNIIATYYDYLGKKFSPPVVGSRKITDVSKLPRMRGYLSDAHQFSTKKLEALGFRYHHTFARDFPSTLPEIFEQATPAIKGAVHRRIYIPRIRKTGRVHARKKTH